MTTMQTKPIELRKEHIESAARVLSRAFRDGPVTRYAYENDKDIDNTLPYEYEFMLRYYLGRFQGFATSERLEGIALWQRYVKSKISLIRLITSGAIWSSFRMSIRASNRIRLFGEYAEKKHAELISSPHWYLMMLGVDPEFQGKGYASLLLRSMLSKIDAEGLPCFLETETEKNVQMYQHFDFNVIEEYTVPRSPVKMWAMLRESRPS